MALAHLMPGTGCRVQQHMQQQGGETPPSDHAIPALFGFATHIALVPGRRLPQGGVVRDSERKGAMTAMSFYLSSLIRCA